MNINYKLWARIVHSVESLLLALIFLTMGVSTSGISTNDTAQSRWVHRDQNEPHPSHAQAVIAPLQSESLSRKRLIINAYVRQNYSSSIPTEIVELFISWTILIDCFDPTKHYKDIKIEQHLESQKITKMSSMSQYSSAFGTNKVSKGDMQSWTVQFKNRAEVIIGIIDNDVVEKKGNVINDFTDSEYNGYGVTFSLDSGYSGNQKLKLAKYHGRRDGSMKAYPSQFDIENDENINITMVLDMTTKQSDKGLLGFIVNANKRSNIAVVLDTGKYSNIAFEVDINKTYRAAFGLWYKAESISILG